MKNKLLYTLQDDLKERLKNPQFKKAWEKSEPEYLLAKKLIETRLANKMSQRNLARRVKTSQAVISRIETMSGNPSLSLLKRISTALNGKLKISISSTARS